MPSGPAGQDIVKSCTSGQWETLICFGTVLSLFTDKCLTQELKGAVGERSPDPRGRQWNCPSEERRREAEQWTREKSKVNLTRWRHLKPAVYFKQDRVDQCTPLTICEDAYGGLLAIKGFKRLFMHHDQPYIIIMKHSCLTDLFAINLCLSCIDIIYPLKTCSNSVNISWNIQKAFIIRHNSNPVICILFVFSTLVLWWKLQWLTSCICVLARFIWVTEIYVVRFKLCVSKMTQSCFQ